jgi:hypothetical protein
MFPFPPLSLSLFFSVGAGAIRWRFKSPTLLSRQPEPLVYWHGAAASRITQGPARRPAGAVLRNWQLAEPLAL